MTIFDWLLQNAIVYEQHSPIDFTIPSVGHFLVISEKDKVFNESFDLELDDQEREVDIDFYCYKFGNQWYYTPKDSIERVTLLPMRYLGKAQLDLDVPYGCLGVHGGFDLLNGSRDYNDWCGKAKFLGVDALGITEKNTLGGVLKFQLSCVKNKIKPVIGIQIVVRRDKEFFQLKCYVKNITGWSNLLLINKEINVINEGFIEQNRLLELLEGLVLVIDPKFTTYKQCLPFSLQIPNLYWQLDTVIFNNEEKDKQYLLNVKEFLSDREMEPVLICDAFYLDKDQDGVKVILNNIADKRDFASSNQYFKSLDEIYQELILLFNDDERMFQLIEKSLENLQVIIQSCNFTVSTEGKHLPAYIMNSDQATNFTSNKELFYYLLEVGVEKRLNKVEDIDVYLDRLETECRVIELGGFIDYFLILWDIVQFAKTNGILTGIGRGSGGGSLIAYLLELTHLDPLRYGLLFERFLNEGRIGKSLPDLDTDFPGERREEIKRYMEQKYGKEQVCSVGTYTTLKVKAALKDLGRQHNISIPTLNYINKILPDDSTFTDLFHIASEKSIVKNFIIDNPEIVEYLPFILNQPKSKSIHACAMLILPDEKNIFEWIPVRTELKDGEKMLVSEWEGPELEAIGLLKEDILGIEQLDKFSKILELVKQNHNIDLDIYTLPLDDELVYDYFCHGYNGDVFHFGSKGLTSYCKDLQPTCIDDLIAGIALYRPGAMESNFHNEYVLRKKGDREVEYLPGTEEITKNTHGIWCFQEQIMQVCRKVGGFSLVEADDIRKAMGKKIQALLDSYRDKFIEGGVKNGYNQSIVEEIWEGLEKFGSYGFNKCISGDEYFLRIGGGNENSPSIGEMFRIKNDSEYARRIGRYPLHQKYKHKGYGTTFSLNENNKLVKNNIKDIRFEGIKPVYIISLENGKEIKVTSNHKFPTLEGDLSIDTGLKVGMSLFFCNGYEFEDTTYRFTTKGSQTRFHNNDLIYKHTINSEKGKEGFQKRDTPYTQLKFYIRNLKKSYCENDECNHISKRLEVHHKNGNHGDNSLENLLTYCSSCHKLAHYKMGRTKQGEKGLQAITYKIKSIKYGGDQAVFDVEMDAPYHTFTTKNGIVTCNSHAAAYAITGYICQWLKVHYPMEFWVVALSRADEKEIPRYMAEINNLRTRVKIKSPDINHSGIGFMVNKEREEILWSIDRVKQCGEEAVKAILEDRLKDGEYFSLDEFISRLPKNKVKKNVIENLILCGLFDQVEGIKNITERLSILKKFYTLRSVKLEDDDFININKDKLRHEWFWILVQKNLCGYGYFDYKKIGRSITTIKDPLIDSEIVHSILEPSQRIRGAFVGVVQEVVIKNSKKGEFAQVLLDHNYENVWVIFWSEIWEDFKDRIIGSEGKILIVTGSLFYDDWRKENVVQTEDFTEIEILS